MKVVALMTVWGIPSLLAAQQVIHQGFGPSPYSMFNLRVAGGGDVDGDAVPDLVVGSAGPLLVVSGATGTVRSVPQSVSGPAFGIVPDLNLDGLGDILVPEGVGLRARSGATLAPLWTTTVAYTAATQVGDRNADGRCDIAAIRAVSPPELHVLSGLDGSVLSSYPVNVNLGTNMFPIGDVNGDGSPEVAVGSASDIVVLQLTAATVLSTLPYAGLRTPVAADFDGDGRLEILASYTTITGDYVVVLSPTTAALLHYLPTPGYSRDFAVLGDLNGDVTPDFAVTAPNGSGVMVSGVDGTVLAPLPTIAGISYGRLVGLGDVNGDGFGDFGNGDEAGRLLIQPLGVWQQLGAWQVVSGKVLAFREIKPTNCAYGPFLPQLGMTLPQIGGNVVVAGQYSPPGTGLVAFSLQPAQETNLGVAGCDAWFDLAGGWLLYTSTTPSWQFAFTVPGVPQLAGVEFALQSVYWPSPTPLGFELSNGLWGRIGW